MASKPPRFNRRLSDRRVTDVKVFAHDGLELSKCKLRDISLDGAFIETDDLTLVEGINVELVLKIRRDGKATHCRLPAKVVRTEGGGAALMFGSLEEELYNTLLDICRDA